MAAEKNWYTINNIDAVDTPALAIYPDRVKKNIQILVESIDDVSRLRPHIKTHKSAEIIRLVLQAGITKFKCATIAEAEVLGMEGAPDVLLAYQPVGPKGERLARLIRQFPLTAYSCLIDNLVTARELSEIFTDHQLPLPVYIDLNVGMNRTGINTTDALSLIQACLALPALNIIGLHAYDGHLRDADLNMREKKCDEGFEAVRVLRNQVKELLHKDLIIVAGGTPTYPIHCRRNDVEASPGTFIYWDQGYAELLTEQKYIFAALVVTRVISKPAPNTICVDLGHKAIASENPLTSRVTFLSTTDLRPIGHSEEHMVLAVEGEDHYAVGDVLYGVPFHICPTVALYQRPAVVEDNEVTSYWDTISRSRMITV